MKRGDPGSLPLVTTLKTPEKGLFFDFYAGVSRIF